MVIRLQTKKHSKRNEEADYIQSNILHKRDDRQNRLDLRHTLGRMYLHFYVHCFQAILHNDDSKMVLCASKRMNSNSKSFIVIMYI